MESPYVKIIADYTAVSHIIQGVILIIFGFTACLADVIMVLGIGIMFGGIFDIVKGYILLKAIVQAQARFVKIFLILFIVTIVLQIIGAIAYIVLHFGMLHVAAKAMFLLYMALLLGFEAFLYYYCQQHYQNLLMANVSLA